MSSNVAIPRNRREPVTNEIPSLARGRDFVRRGIRSEGTATPSKNVPQVGKFGNARVLGASSRKREAVISHLEIAERNPSDLRLLLDNLGQRGRWITTPNQSYFGHLQTMNGDGLGE